MTVTPVPPVPPQSVITGGLGTEEMMVTSAHELTRVLSRSQYQSVGRSHASTRRAPSDAHQFDHTVRLAAGVSA